ncbi:hypothetical protein LXA43DRAFT_1108453 [Ganoderma leucocontextum]|nr:hypothetical protein LXA43DRAFT_1108453 [Ganoderma leucocontextum]
MPPAIQDTSARGGSDTDLEDDLDVPQTQSLGHNEHDEQAVRPPPPTSQRIMHRQSAALFQRLAAEAAAATSTHPAPAVAAAPRRSTRAPVVMPKGKNIASPATWDPAGPPLQDSLRSLAVAGCKSQQVLPAVRDDLCLLAATVNHVLDSQSADRSLHVEEQGRLQGAVETLTATVAALNDAVRAGAPPAQGVQDPAGLQHMQHTVSLLSSAVERNENDTNVQFQDLENQRDQALDDIADLRASVEKLAQGVADLKAAQGAPASQSGRRFKPIPLPPLPFGLGQPGSGGTPSAAAARNQNGKRHSQDDASSAAKKARPVQQADSHVASSVSTANTTTGSSSATQLSVGADNATVVRFGSVDWPADPDQLRVQIYVAAKPAWDSVEALHATLRAYSRDPDDEGYVFLDFPNRDLAERFVKAWATERIHAGRFRRAQAHIL